jgi:hypothetical protein
VLRERHNLGEAEARAASAVADGSVARGLAASEGELTAARDLAAGLLRQVATGPPARRMQGAKAFVAASRSAAVDRATLAERLRVMASLLRDLGILTSRADPALLANTDIRDDLESLRKAFAADRVVRAFSSVDRALTALDRNASPKIVADWVSLEI